MRWQRRRGDEPHLVALRGSEIARRAAGEGLPVHPVPMRGTWDLASAAAIARLHHVLRPDVVHWHAARAHALGAMAATLAPGPARVLSRRVVVPVRRSIGSRLLYSLPIDAIAAISAAVRATLILSGVDSARIRIVPSGIDASPFLGAVDRPSLRERLGMPGSEIVVLNVAALTREKGHADLLHALAAARSRAPALRLWIVGEGPLEATLRAEAQTLGLGDAVRFLGFRSDVSDLLRAADLFCLPSRLEGLGTSILEGMAAGLAVVATTAGGIPEIVIDGETGVLVPPRDPEALSAALVRLAEDPALRSALGARGRERSRIFGVEPMVERTRALYLQALEARLTGLLGKDHAAAG